MSEQARPGRAVLALAGALVVALGVIAWLVAARGAAVDDRDAARAAASSAADADEAGADALAAAQQVMVDITTYSWRDGEHEFAWLDQIAGDELAERLAPNVPALQEAIVAGKVSAKGQVLDAAARVVDPAQVEVLAFVDQAITDETNTDVRVEEQRVSMTMVLVDGAWLVERLELLSGTNLATSGTSAE